MTKTYRKAAALLLATVMGVGLISCGSGIRGRTASSASTEPVPSSTSSSGDVLLQETMDDTEGAVLLLENFYKESIAGYVPPSALIFYIEGRGVVHADGTAGPDKAHCGSEELDGPNAFYCIPDNSVVASLDFLLGNQETIGDASTYVIFAHEYGHSAQAAVGFVPATEFDTTELQADCYAGGFIQAEIEAGDLTVEDGDEGEMNRSLAEVADEYGRPGNHGTLAGRATAFEYGRNNGAPACQVEYR